MRCIASLSRNSSAEPINCCQLSRAQPLHSKDVIYIIIYTISGAEINRKFKSTQHTHIYIHIRIFASRNLYKCYKMCYKYISMSKMRQKITNAIMKVTKCSSEIPELKLLNVSRYRDELNYRGSQVSTASRSSFFAPSKIPSKTLIKARVTDLEYKFAPYTRKFSRVVASVA